MKIKKVRGAALCITRVYNKCKKVKIICSLLSPKMANKTGLLLATLDYMPSFGHAELLEHPQFKKNRFIDRCI